MHLKYLVLMVSNKQSDHNVKHLKYLVLMASIIVKHMQGSVLLFCHEVIEKVFMN
jgi:hypothetical protein